MNEKIYKTSLGNIHYWVNILDKDAVTLVFLPGLTADHRLFNKQITYFENKYNVFVWDAPAHASSWPFKFEFDLEVKKCLYGKYIDYCAQSFSNLGDRIVQVNWQKSIVYPDMPWGSNLSLPQEVTMHKTLDGKLQLHTYIAKEFEKELYKGVKPDYDCGYDIKANIDVNEKSIIKCFGIEIPLPIEYKEATLDVRIIVDTIGVSFYINGGVKYTSLAILPNYDLIPLEIENGKINTNEVYDEYDEE